MLDEQDLLLFGRRWNKLRERECCAMKNATIRTLRVELAGLDVEPGMLYIKARTRG